jgi:hypothetical protein
LKIIKEFSHFSRRCVIRTDMFHHSLEFFVGLDAIAKQDFPELRSDVTVVHFADRHYGGTFGIEFEAPGNVKIPPEYVEVVKHEFLR